MVHQVIWVPFMYAFVAPEVMCRLKHGVASDYFAVGIIVWECMFGKVDSCIFIYI